MQDKKKPVTELKLNTICKETSIHSKVLNSVGEAKPDVLWPDTSDCTAPAEGTLSGHGIT